MTDPARRDEHDPGHGIDGPEPARAVGRTEPTTPGTTEPTTPGTTEPTTPGTTAPTALVTGASGHIGRALQRLLTAAGYRTIGVDRPGTAAPVGSDAPSHWIELDLADPGATSQLSEALAGVPRLELVVAGAGVTALGDLATTTDATFERVMEVNFHGALRTVRATLPALRTARGQIVVVSSVAGLLPVPGRPAYVGAKHAVTGTFLALADELASGGVAVTVLHPGFLRTPVTASGAPDQADDATPRSTTGSALTAEDVARVILRLAARRRAGKRVPARVLVGRTARLADVAARIAPTLARSLAARRLRD